MKVNELDYIHLIPACINTHFSRVPFREDLTLQGLIGLRDGICKHNPNKKNAMWLEPYLYQTIRNRCGWYTQWKTHYKCSRYYTTGKKGSYETHYRHVDQTETNHPKNRTLPDRDDLLMLRKALSNGLLTRRQKEVIRMYYYVGMSIPEIAKEDGTTPQNISMLKREAERKMRKYFDS